MDVEMILRVKDKVEIFIFSLTKLRAPSYITKLFFFCQQYTKWTCHHHSRRLTTDIHRMIHLRNISEGQDPN